MRSAVDSRLESNLKNLDKQPLFNCIPQELRYHLAQSAPKERALFGIELFGEGSTLEPSLRWER